MKKISQSKKANIACEKCGGTSFENLITNYPLNLLDKQIMVQRVSVKKCLACQALFPTTKGIEKLERCLQAYISLPI